MEPETLKLNRVQFTRLRKMEKMLKDELKRESAYIEVPALVRANLSFQFNPSIPSGRQEELLIQIESRFFEIPLTERGNAPGYPARSRTASTIFIPLNRSFKNQKIIIRGLNKVYPGAQDWYESDMKLLQDKPLEKILGFNSAAQPDNYEAMKCTVTFY